MAENKSTGSNYYKDLLESLNALIVRVDSENRFTYVNSRYCEIFGKCRDELIGQSFLPWFTRMTLSLPGSQWKTCIVLLIVAN
jgi:PAS domain-containing protein